MRQLTLDIRPEAPPSFYNFIAGANCELLARLCALAAPGVCEAVYLWGPPGSGRSHLLRATHAAARTQRPSDLLDATAISDELPLAPGGVLLVDDVERLRPAGQIALFRAFNAAPPIGLALLVAGAAPPLQLAVREDLRTRIGAALIYEVKPLTEEEKADTLARHAQERGMRIERELIDYLLRHGRRDLPWLMAVLEALDQCSLEQQRLITLPLLKEILARAPA